jgi:ribosomal protein S18 acetylase RimI-like enzyme
MKKMDKLETENITFASYNDKYKQDLYKLQTDQWGEGSDTDDLFIDADLNKRYIKIALKDEKLIGACVSTIENKSCHLDFIIIKPKFQRLGLGTYLLSDTIKYAKDKNCKKIVAEAFDVCGKINSLKLLENFGFKRIKSFENYWGNLTPDFDCKECGHKPCICSMHLYELKLQ